jgi:hypothetical protein
MAPSGRNYESPPWCYLLWGVPAAMIFAGDAAYRGSYISPTLAGSTWALSVLWIGAGCFLNGRSCGRIHCIIDGLAMPVLSVVGLLDAFSLVSLSWNYFWAVFFIVLTVSFVPELVWKRYA